MVSRNHTRFSTVVCVLCFYSLFVLMFGNGRKQTSLSIIIARGLEINKRCLRQRNWLGPVQGLPATTNLLPRKETPLRGLIYRVRYTISLKSKPTFHQSEWWVSQPLQGCKGTSVLWWHLGAGASNTGCGQQV